MSLRMRLFVLAGIVVAGVAVVGALLAGTLIAERRALRDQEDLVRASASQGALLARYVDQETALRGFLLSGDQAFLGPYEDASREIPALTEELTRGVGSSTALSGKAAALLQAHDRWSAEVLQPELRAGRAGDLAGARSEESSGRGKVLFDATRARAQDLAADLRQRSVAAGRDVSGLSNRLGWLLAAALVALVALVVVQLLGALRLVLAPLLHLGEDVRLVAGGQLDHAVSDSGPRELAAVGRGTEAMRVRLRTELEQVVRSREALAQSGPAVLALQAALTPTRAHVAGLSLAYRLEAAEGMLAGDWLDTLVLPGRRLGVVLGDVSGHGPGPAVFALRLKHMLAAALTSGRTPGDTLQWAARQIGDTDELFATVFVAVLDPGGDELVYASAGHPDALLLRGDGPAEPLPATGPLLSGLVAGWGWGDSEHVFGVDDLLLSYTDGLLEARDGAGRQFGPDRLLDAVGHRSDRDDLDVLLDRTVAGVRAFSGARLTDDCTLLACRHVPYDRQRT